MSEAVPQTRRWLYGRVPDLLLGCGIGSIAVMVVQAEVGPALSSWVPSALLILIFSLPHYGATLVRAYEDETDRRKYRFVTLWSTIVVAAAFVLGLRWAGFGSLVLTVYLTWSPWHYSAQNYGISMMMLGRRGAKLAPFSKRLLRGTFVLSYVLTFLAIHSASPQGSYAPVSYAGTVFELLPIGLPHDIVGVLIIVLGSVYALALAGTVVVLLRAGRPAAVLPTLSLLLTQALWFALPVPIRHFGLAGPDSVFALVYTASGFLWIAAYHSIQYLWITTYYATESREAVAADPRAWSRRLRFLGKAVLAGYAIWTLPALVFAPGLLGSLPHESGLALLVAATVNLHHFVLDGALWKLRDGRVARVLLQTAEPEDSSPLEAGGVGWGRRITYGLGALCVLYGVVTFWGGDLGFERALSRGDIPAARTAMERLVLLGRDGPNRHTQLGRRLARQGERRPALREFVRGIELTPTVRGWSSLGLLYEQGKEWRKAANAYDSALALEPQNVSNRVRAGKAWLEGGRPEKAVEQLEAAARLAPEEKTIQLLLIRARREAEQAGESGEVGS